MKSRTGVGRAVVLILVVIGLATGLSGCLPQPSHPEFDLPVGWSGENGTGIEYESPVFLLLHDDGSARLTNVPSGNWRQTPTGICWATDGKRYSGEATWRVWSERGVEVTFGESEVIFWAYPGKFGSFGWVDLKMVTCDGDAWGMSLACGHAGGYSAPPCGDVGRER